VRAILAGHRKASGLTPAVPTIATALKKLGYHTGISGKWHLGLKNECRPNSNGFDEFDGFLAGCVDYYSHIFYWGMADGNTNPVHDLWENETEVYDNGEYMTERITQKSIEFIQRNEDRPFFLYVAYNAPHYPMHAPEKYMKRFEHLPKDRQLMAAMISAVDDGVGEIRAELERRGLLENTIIYFQSDNGPSRESRNWLDGTEDLYYGGSTGVFSGHKFSLFEGGIRVPSLLFWKGIIKSEVIDAPHIATDIFPTILELCGGSPDEYELDGISLKEMLCSGGEALHDYIFWEMEDQTAVRKGKYKLVLNGRTDEGEEPRADVFLSDLESDPGEKHNLARELPGLFDELKKAALEWRAGIEKTWEEKFEKNYTSLA
ncbi:MAG: sulfatase-like hydrolase/transferase, partial [Clostridia bacterium]|nr:sulfatase-like hydrolase/transferase [Clostridia bacterium]